MSGGKATNTTGKKRCHHFVWLWSGWPCFTLDWPSHVYNQHPHVLTNGWMAVTKPLLLLLLMSHFSFLSLCLFISV
jgi:hypothetical protein